jgi:hypothetical protein
MLMRERKWRLATTEDVFSWWFSPEGQGEAANPKAKKKKLCEGDFQMMQPELYQQR